RSVVQVGGQIDAELLDDAARYFGDGDFQHHLIAAANGDAVDHLFRSADQPRREIAGLLHVDRVRYRTRQHHAVVDAFNLDVGIGQDLPQGGADAVEVALDRDVIGGDLLA